MLVRNIDNNVVSGVQHCAETELLCTRETGSEAARAASDTAASKTPVSSARHHQHQDDEHEQSQASSHAHTDTDTAACSTGNHIQLHRNRYTSISTLYCLSVCLSSECPLSERD